MFQNMSNKTPFHDPKVLARELDYERGRLRHITRRFCTGMCTINHYEMEDQSPFVNLAFDLINQEVMKYQVKLAGGKIR